MFAKITLELPASLLRQIKTAALRCQMTLQQFICDALQEKLARMSHVNVRQRQTFIPPPPKIPLKELKAIHKKMLAAAAKIHPDDWK